MESGFANTFPELFQFSFELGNPGIVGFTYIVAEGKRPRLELFPELITRERGQEERGDGPYQRTAHGTCDKGCKAAHLAPPAAIIAHLNPIPNPESDCWQKPIRYTPSAHCIGQANIP
jgi:hypothetical protein